MSAIALLRRWLAVPPISLSCSPRSPSLFAGLQPGSGLFQFEQHQHYFYPYQRSAAWSPPREKAVALAMLDRPVLVPMTYLVRGHQPVFYAPAYEPLYRFQHKVHLPAVASRADFLSWLAA